MNGSSPMENKFIDRFEKNRIESYLRGDYLGEIVAREKYLLMISALGYASEEEYNSLFLEIINHRWLSFLGKKPSDSGTYLIISKKYCSN